MRKTIFLVDMNAFFISCEEHLDKKLKVMNAAVAGDPKSRTGIILTANYNARKYGVRTAMTVSEAKKLCTDLVLIKPDHELYQEVSVRIMGILRGFSPIVEQNSIDEAWIDMTGADKLYKRSFTEIAYDIRDAIYQREEIPCSIGISFNKFLSKMAAELKKPNGIVFIDEGNFKQMIWPLKTEKMYGCGRIMSEKLKSLNILTIGDLAVSDPVLLRKKLGRAGESLYYSANAKDSADEGMCLDPIAGSISRETTLTKDTLDKDELKNYLKPLIDDVAKQVREKNCYFTTIYIIMKFNDFTRITRRRKVEGAGSRDSILKTILSIIDENDILKPVRLIGVGVTGLGEKNITQIDLFVSDSDKSDDIYKIIDEKNNKYGTDIIKRGFYRYGNKG